MPDEMILVPGPVASACMAECNPFIPIHPKFNDSGAVTNCPKVYMELYESHSSIKQNIHF